MNKYEQALVSAVKQITEIDAAKAVSDARWLNGMLRDFAPQVIGQREYKMLTALLNCNGNRILAEAAKKPAAARDAEVERLVRRLCDEYVMDEDAARRICALYLASVTGNDAFVTADDRRKAKPEPTPTPKPKPAPTPAPKPAPEPKPAPTPAPTPKPAPQKAADDGRGQRSTGKSKKWIIGTLLAVIFAVIAWQVIANRDTAVDDPARDKRMVEAWVKVNDRVLADVKSTEFDYLNCTGPEDLKADLANRSGIYSADGVDMSSNFTLSKDETEYVESSGNVHVQNADLYDAAGEEHISINFQNYLDPENIPGNTPGVNHSISTECRYLTSEGASLFSAYLPESVAGICGMDREAMLNYLGITDEMMSWLCNPNVKKSQAFNEYESDGYGRRSPGFYPNAGTDKYGSLFFHEMYEKDNGELVALGLCIFILSDDSIQMEAYYNFEQYPEPDAVDREIPTQEELKEAGVDKVYTAEDLRMAKAWIAARDKVISGAALSGIDLMKPTGIADLGMYLEGVDGLYFDNGGEYTDSYSDDVLRDYGGDEGIYLDFCGFDIHDYDVLGRIVYSPQGSQLLSNYRGRGSLSIDVKVVETTKNAADMSAIMPDMLCQLLGSDREALLRGLGVSQEMLDWRNKNRDENGIMYELFGRSDPWYWGENHIIFSRFVEGTDGGTVCIEVGIDIPEDGKGFERAVITYTYY